MESLLSFIDFVSTIKVSLLLFCSLFCCCLGSCLNFLFDDDLPDDDNESLLSSLLSYSFFSSLKLLLLSYSRNTLLLFDFLL
jgi:hypothetical protein